MLFKKSLLYVPVLLFIIINSCSTTKEETPRILVFTKTAGYHHSSIPNGVAAIEKLGSENGFNVDTTSDANMFTEDTLKKYAAVVFLSTTGNLFNGHQEADFERYIQAGGGYMGIHAAADAEYDWHWYGRLVGGYFDSHPMQQTATLDVVDTADASTKFLPHKWSRKDEWYNYKQTNPDVHVVLKIDESSYEGGNMHGNHPMAWYHEYDGGRAFYTELGHTEESYTDTLYLKHILAGIKYAIGDNKNLDYVKAKTMRTPDDDRFVKDQLVTGTFFEPTEMAILPNLDILVAQRRGEIMFYNHATKQVTQAGFLNVYFKANVPNVNTEEGLLGITLDPDFKNNNYVYIYYSPVDSSVDRLSRFTFTNNKIDSTSEKTILEVKTTREICCHTGGSLAFGKDNQLFLSTGDNSTPFDAPSPIANHGFAPLDNRPGNAQYDARRSAGNTNDLRGKILRVKINPDGSYTIPDGNLFPKGNDKARPEIYVMGDRNPYRISVDKQTGYLYWGEVGPDANNDSLDTRGPRGYDEVNQARKAGNFGWPYFIGNNYPYHQYDYKTGTTGPLFDVAKPINNSPNNTGLEQLPPAQAAFIWYPYAASPDFPSVGTGGRTAMAGPVYYMDNYPSSTRYPEYYNKKLFIYEWIRGWVKAVTMLPDGSYDKMESFADSIKLNNAIDIEMGPDGNLYALEYGSGWFAKNPDAGLARIRYISGNRPPKVSALHVEQLNGNLPFVVKASVDAKDPERDDLTYTWHIGSAVEKTIKPTLEYSIKQAGNYNVSVTVSDSHEDSADSKIISVYAGNAQPSVAIEIQGNKSFYFPGRSIDYNVAVTDNGEPVVDTNLYVTTDYVTGKNQEAISFGHMIMTAAAEGQTIIGNNDCKTCHKVDEKSIGPSFTQVAEKYRNDFTASSFLPEKIMKGGSGVWGEVQMPAHPSITLDDANKIIAYIFSLSSTKASKTLASKGTIKPDATKLSQPGSEFVIKASYVDAGGTGKKPLSAAGDLYLRSNTINAVTLNNDNFTVLDSAGFKYIVMPSENQALQLKHVDLTGITAITLNGTGRNKAADYTITIYTESANGTKIGEGKISFSGNKSAVLTSVPIQATTGMKDVYISISPVGKTDANPLLKTVVFKN